MSDIYVGLMSGTSMDGIDAVAVRFGDRSVEMLATHSQPYPADLRQQLLSAIRLPLDAGFDNLEELHRRVGEIFRDTAVAVIAKGNFSSGQVMAIASHGQTLRHQPNASPPFSLQIGDADVIASGTGIQTIANFRQADIAAGGQGAPLVPPFHQWLFQSSSEERVIANIGGIANITVLPADGAAVRGFDTGPGNNLMDGWIRKHRGEAYDAAGHWASGGEIKRDLLQRLLGDPYFAMPPPKSTGFEYFNAAWLTQYDAGQYAAADVQATLCELSAISIARGVDEHAPEARQLFVCGGGAHNTQLVKRLASHLPETSVSSTASAGLDPDWVEAAAFAWLGMRHLQELPGNLPSVTGASHSVTLGELHYPAQ